MPTKDTITKYKAAAVQAEPGWFNLEKSVQKTVDLINEAGEKGCKLIAFPETCMSNQRRCASIKLTRFRDSRISILAMASQLPGLSSAPQGVP